MEPSRPVQASIFLFIVTINL